jgi:hypothetical protein
MKTCKLCDTEEAEVCPHCHLLVVRALVSFQKLHKIRIEDVIKSLQHMRDEQCWDYENNVSEACKKWFEAGVNNAIVLLNNKFIDLK